MYTEENITGTLMEHTKQITAMNESVKSAHKRIDETDRIASGVHDLAKSTAEMATEIKLLTSNMNTSLERIEKGQKEQGTQIVQIEKTILTINRNEKQLEDHEKRLDEIEREPAKKWDKFTWLIIAGIATAVIAFLIGRIL